jgi:hypothetical protein
MRIARALVLVIALTASGSAEARSQREVAHVYDDVFPAAVRFLRIDANLKIVEKDAESGYVLFELAEEGKTFRGALELIRFQDSEGRAGVRLVIRVDDRPTYTETGLLERLVAKLDRELPESPPPPPPKKE